MEMNNLLEQRFQLLTGETDLEKVSSFLLSAEATILSRTNRRKMIDELSEAKLQLAVARYNKRGNEGLSSYNEGGESETYLSEDDILSGIASYRLSALGRRVKDEKEESTKI
ncbi:phage head-tail connector protein [Candidatus Stoquefichus massiliensis]|uniref:phage head-tail connector protein n=1 Tax=Candidatus Stoquefichus massiliensis TaxID=1470350 RepID=UPI0004B6CC3D|nr:phage head-tail connector protein [Candidatus Stoquefichus massiliensis]